MKDKYLEFYNFGIDALANQGDEGAITRRDYAYVGWQAAKAQAVSETQQAVIDELKAQLKAVHDSRVAFVEYCRMIEAQEKDND